MPGIFPTFLFYSLLQESDVILKRKKYNKTYDVIGGKDFCGDPFIFSDGVGKLSEDFAEQIAKDLGLGKCVPSCFQVRMIFC